MKKIAVVGHFADGQQYLDGQTVKTKILTRALMERYGQTAVQRVDTCGWKKRPVRFFGRVFCAVRDTQNVLMLPAHNGLRVMTPILSLYNLFLNRKLHYVVIGGWLPEFLQKRKVLARQLKRFAGIYVETSTMKKALDSMGFENVVVLPNCKQLPILSPEQLPLLQKPYKLCTFSRVMKEKGIEDAVAAVIAVNEVLGETVYTLDIYGQVDTNQIQWFEDLQKTFPEYIRYGGLVPFDQSVEVLKDYFALLFPTRFYTEGIPGTVIDSYAAGVPVISAKWESFADVIKDGVTGYGYEFENVDTVEQLLLRIAEKPEMVTDLKENCLKTAKDYLPETAVAILAKKVEGVSLCGQ